MCLTARFNGNGRSVPCHRDRHRRPFYIASDVTEIGNRLPFDMGGSKESVTIPPIDPIVSRTAKYLKGTWDIEWTR